MTIATQMSLALQRIKYKILRKEMVQEILVDYNLYIP
jgi:hypothetical protein